MMNVRDAIVSDRWPDHQLCADDQAKLHRMRRYWHVPDDVEVSDDDIFELPIDELDARMAAEFGDEAVINADKFVSRPELSLHHDVANKPSKPVKYCLVAHRAQTLTRKAGRIPTARVVVGSAVATLIFAFLLGFSTGTNRDGLSLKTSDFIDMIADNVVPNHAVSIPAVSPAQTESIEPVIAGAQGSFAVSDAPLPRQKPIHRQENLAFSAVLNVAGENGLLEGTQLSSVLLHLLEAKQDSLVGHMITYDTKTWKFEAERNGVTVQVFSARLTEAISNPYLAAVKLGILKPDYMQVAKTYKNFAGFDPKDMRIGDVVQAIIHKVGGTTTVERVAIWNDEAQTFRKLCSEVPEACAEVNESDAETVSTVAQSTRDTIAHLDPQK